MDAQTSLLLSDSILSEGREKRTGTRELIHLRGCVIYNSVNSELVARLLWTSCGFWISAL
jgi:hypothetical protein